MNALQTEGETEVRAALSWAEIAGLVQVHADGSWNATDLARRALREQDSELGQRSFPEQATSQRH
jgi:hypothetical protein